MQLYKNNSAIWKERFKTM